MQEQPRAPKPGLLQRERGKAKGRFLAFDFTILVTFRKKGSIKPPFSFFCSLRKSFCRESFTSAILPSLTYCEMSIVRVKSPLEQLKMAVQFPRVPPTTYAGVQLVTAYSDTFEV